MRIDRKVFGNSVGLDLVVPRKNENDYGELDSISYNSLLGSRETVNIPVLWVDDEVYVLIDGIYKAMGELLIKPRVMGNMEKIPVYIYSKLIFNDEISKIISDNLFVSNGDEKYYFSNIIRNHNGYYVPLNELQEYFSDNLKITVCKENEKNILNKIKNVNFYNLKNDSLNLLTSDTALKNNDEIYVNTAQLETALNNLTIENSTAEAYSKAKASNNNTSLINRKIILRTFINKYRSKYNLHIYTASSNHTSIIILERNNKAILFYAPHYSIDVKQESIDNSISNAISGYINENGYKPNIKKYFSATTTKSGKMLVYTNDLLCDNIIVKENEKADARHFAGDLFDSFDDAFEMLKMYYALDDNYIKNKDNYYMGFAIYATGKCFAYSGAVDYQTLLNLQYVANDGTKPIRAYVFPDVIDNKISLEKLLNHYDYFSIVLYYKDTQNNYVKMDIPYTEKGIAFIKSWEKCSLKSYDAKKGRGDWTIGWGHKLYEYDGYIENPNIIITQAEADKLFDEDLKKNMNASFIPFLESHNVTLTKNQFDALLSFTYNYGEYSWNTDDIKTMKKFVAKKNFSEKATKEAFEKYISMSEAGAIQRRKDELEIFLYGRYNYHN